MGRSRRTDFDGAIHHVMNRGVDRQPIFFGDEDRIEFGRRLDAIHGEFGIETLAYCLMGNHFHLVLRTPGGHLSEAMHHLGSVYTRHTNDRVGRDGPLFRGRFHSIVISTDAYLLTAVRYVHRNALDLPGVHSVDAYRWSSYRTYVQRRHPPRFLNTDLVLGCFGRDIDRFADFHTAVEPGHGGGPVPTDADLDELISFAIAEDDLRCDGLDQTPWRERTVRLLLLDRFPTAPWRPELEAALGLPSPTARRMAIHRARKRAGDPAIGRVVRRIVELLPEQHRAA